MTSQEWWIQRRALFLLAVGAVLGIACGAGAVLRASQPNGDAVPDGAVALVNGKAISAEDYARAVAMVASDKRGDITAADRVHVLNRLIDEELLIQYGIGMGLLESNRAVRQAITQAMLASVVTEHMSERPSDDVLRAFYEENLSVFVRSTPKSDLQLPAKEGEEPLPFDDLRAQVEEVYLQRARDEALREYLAWLRSEAEIVLESDVSPPVSVKQDGQEGEYERE